MHWDNVLKQSNHPHSRWLNTPQAARDRILSGAVIPYVQPSFSLQKEDSIFAIGSCFARNVEEYLTDCGCRVQSNHFDIPLTEVETGRRAGLFNKYNPISILQELEWAKGVRKFPTHSLIEIAPGKYYDPFLRSKAQTGSLDEVLARRSGVSEYFNRAFSSNLVIITLGLTETWFDEETGAALNEPPPLRAIKKAPDRYSFRRLSYSEVRNSVSSALDLLADAGGQRPPKVVITVSPVALGRTFTNSDVIIANHTSKFTLHAAATDICADGRADYFPSFDAAIVSSPSLVYMDDRLHVSESMVGIIIKTFLHRYGLSAEPPLSDDTSSTNDKTDPRQKLLEQLRKDNDRLRNQIVNLTNKL